MGIWKAFNRGQHLARYESHGYVSLSHFYGMAFKQAFVDATAGCGLVYVVHNLLDCVCHIPSSGSLST